MHRPLIAAAFAALFAIPAHAVHVNQQTFVANGGHLQNVPGTAPNVFDQLRSASYAAHFNPVGDLGGCAGTWLGTEHNYAWILTAAHCVPTSTLMRTVGHLTFRDGYDRALAGGAGGLAFVHPHRLQPPPGVGQAGSDIAVLRLPLLPAGRSGALPGAPYIHDRQVQAGSKLALVGHGSTGVANTPVDPYWPKQGVRRAWGETQLDSVLENGHLAVAGFGPTQSSTHWARAGVGDGGAAWWQRLDGEWSVIATTNGGNATATTGALIAKYATWIDDLFPGARMTGERLRVAESGRFTSYNYALDMPDDRGDWSRKGWWWHSAPQVYFVVAPDQPGVEGPRSGSWSYELRHTSLTVPLRDAWGKTTPVKLRAIRKVGWCGNTHMDNVALCPDGIAAGTLEIWFDRADNRGLPDHQWRGRVTLDALGASAPFHRRFDVDIDIDIDLTEKARVTRHGMYESRNFVSHRYFPSGNVYFVVPYQPGASGPVHPNWTTNRLGGHSTIVVNARSAVTQKVVPVKLRAQRFLTCWPWSEMNNARDCELDFSPNAKLRAWFDPADNPGLPPDRYRGEVFITYAGIVGGLIRLEVDIDTLP